MSSTPTKSRYTPIWNQLKETSKCRLTAPPVLHPRIIKAVKKRKELDLAFAFLLAEDCKKAKLHFKSDGSILSISLSISIGLSEL